MCLLFCWKFPSTDLSNADSCFTPTQAELEEKEAEAKAALIAEFELAQTRIGYRPTLTPEAASASSSSKSSPMKRAIEGKTYLAPQK